MARIAATCTTETLTFVKKTGIRSGIHKVPREWIDVLTHGVIGDVQGDKEHHGGLFKAVYAFAKETREAIAREKGAEYPAGHFGENLVTEDFDLDEIVIGTRIRVGGAVLEASTVRQPCATFNQWMAERTWGRFFTEYGACGAYFRVIEEGRIAPGDELETLSVPGHGVTVGQMFRSLATEVDPHAAKALLAWACESSTVLYSSMVASCSAAIQGAGMTQNFPEALRSDGRG